MLDNAPCPNCAVMWYSTARWPQARSFTVTTAPVTSERVAGTASTTRRCWEACSVRRSVLDAGDRFEAWEAGGAFVPRLLHAPVQPVPRRLGGEEVKHAARTHSGQ